MYAMSICAHTHAHTYTHMLCLCSKHMYGMLLKMVKSHSFGQFLQSNITRKSGVLTCHYQVHIDIVFPLEVDRMAELRGTFGQANILRGMHCIA